jgi:hypothetical protein
LEYICEYVASGDRRPRSLFSLSLASRLCCLAATAQRFSRLRLTIRDKKKLRDDVRRWTEILSLDNRFRHVRRVTVVGFMRDDESPIYSRQKDWANGWPADNDDDSDSDSDSDGLPPLHPRFAPAVTRDFFPAKPALTPLHKQAQHAAWLPFAHFLAQLPGLTDLVYACTHQLPRCVLDALHQHHPRSRLHMHAFSFRSLHQARDTPTDIDPDEFALATSPCLYSIDTKLEAHGSPGLVDYNLDAVARMVTGYAPAIRRVRVNYYAPARSASKRNTTPWQGFLADSPDRHAAGQGEAAAVSKRGCLDTLYLSDDRRLEDWNARTDFGHLRRFELQYIMFGHPTLETLVRMARHDEFRSLRELGLAATWHEDKQGQDELISLFLLAVPPLKVLKLGLHFGERAFGAALRRHGSTLRRLHLDPDAEGGFVLSPERICEMQQCCPGLDDVQLCIPRRQGGPEEVAIYRTLGRLPQLRRLTLLLDCHNGLLEDDEEVKALNTLYDAEGDGQDPERDVYREIQLLVARKTLINAAVDEALARAIFHEIVNVVNAPLERLFIDPKIPEFVFPDDIGSDFDHLAQWIGRSWVCTKYNTRDRDDVLVRRKVVDKWYGWPEEAPSNVDEECIDLWTELWPRRAADWWDLVSLEEAGLAGRDT